MKRLFIPLTTVMCLVSLTACLSPTDAPRTNDAASSSSAISSLDYDDAEESLGEEYVGLTVDEAQTKAEAEGVPFRVVERDGEALPVTMDFVPGRINATVENDMVTGYEIEGVSLEEEGGSEYDQDSWKVMIDDSCLVFFDGCNTCRRTADNDPVSCTKKGCMEYREPRCLDRQSQSSVSSAVPVSETTYECDDDNIFTVHRGLYVSDGERVTLDQDEIIFVDHQDDEAYAMTDVLDDDKEYRGEDGRSLVFDDDGTTMVYRNGVTFYENCR